MAIQPNATFNVCWSRPTIINVQMIAPNVLTTGAIGALNGRSMFGALTLNIQTPILTST
ncbi:MAG: hypothetical protein RLZZ390_1214, partial [Bacteroidota bacterium]